MYDIEYRCPECGEEWEDQWPSVCDADCPACALTDIEALTSSPILLTPKTIEVLNYSDVRKMLITDQQESGNHFDESFVESEEVDSLSYGMNPMTLVSVPWFHNVVMRFESVDPEKLLVFRKRHLHAFVNLEA